MSSGSGIRAKRPAKLNGDIGQQRPRRRLEENGLLSTRCCHGGADMNKTDEVVVVFAKSREQNESAVTRGQDELTLDEIAQKLGLTYEEAISSMVRSKHKPPVEP